MMGWELDERQKGLAYKAGYESFLLLSTLEFIKEFVLSYDIKYFAGSQGNLAIVYIAFWYFNIRKAMLDCEVPDKKRARNRISTTIAMLIFTAFIIFWLFDGHGLRWIEDDKTAGPAFLLSMAFISGWIITVITWIQKRKGYEE